MQRTKLLQALLMFRFEEERILILRKVAVCNQTGYAKVFVKGSS